MTHLELPITSAGVAGAIGTLAGDLTEADLRGADLAGTRLAGIGAARADLAFADLRGADLRDAVLVNANLRSARLEGADLSGADLRGAELGDATVDADTRWTGALISVGSILPDGLERSVIGDLMIEPTRHLVGGTR